MKDRDPDLVFSFPFFFGRIIVSFFVVSWRVGDYARASEGLLVTP